LVYFRLLWWGFFGLKVFCFENGRHDWIRTSDLFRVKLPGICDFNNLQVAGDCQIPAKKA